MEVVITMSQRKQTNKEEKTKVDNVDPKFVKTSAIYKKNGKKIGRYKGRMFEMINQIYGMWSDTGDLFLLKDLK